MYKTKYTWNEDTLDHFHHAMFWKPARQVYEEIQEFVECDCQLEDNETEQDLIDDLYNTLYK
tara:strand:+ start:248 stop:433 length:186 start_codon:yes stop_codon:yes gene_type:complete